VPIATVIPPVDQSLSSQLMLAEGPMARRVADVRAGLEVLVGPDVRDPVSLPVTLTDTVPGERLRIAVLDDPPGGATDPGIRAAVRRAADVLADAGHDVVDAVPPGYEEVLDRWGQLLTTDVRAQLGLLEAVMGAGGRAVLANFEAFVPPLDAAGQFELHVRRYALMREWSAFFVEHPVLLSPVWAQRAFEHDADIEGSASGAMLETFRPVLAGNFLGLPGAVVPAGLAEGLPVGVQVIGDRFTDLRCLTVAAQIEAAIAPLTPIDPVPAFDTVGV
jgi:amidase